MYASCYGYLRDHQEKEDMIGEDWLRICVSGDVLVSLGHTISVWNVKDGKCLACHMDTCSTFRYSLRY